MPLGLLDLSIVTDMLLKHLSDSEAASRLWAEEPTRPLGPPNPLPSPAAQFSINFTGLPPDVARKKAGCQLSLYLFHVAPDKFYRTTFPLQDRVGTGPTQHFVAPRPRTIPEQPLALTLYYLLSAHSENYIEEQQAMSIALKCFHDNPIVTATVPKDNRTEEFTLTMEPQSVDEIGRLWQAISSPLRLSVVYRASVIFLEPETVDRAPPALVTQADVKAYPQLIITRAVVTPVGLATITGSGFSAGLTTVAIDGGALQPGPPNPMNPLTAGTFRIVSPTTLVIQLPAGAHTGKHLLAVQPDPERPAALFTLDVP